jgi:hypothetical protein
VPQADMFECKLEILLLVPYSTIKYAHLNMQPQRGQYNNVLANNTYLVAFVKRLNYMISGLGDLKGQFAESKFYPIIFVKSFVSKFYL